MRFLLFFAALTLFFCSVQGTFFSVEGSPFYFAWKNFMGNLEQTNPYVFSALQKDAYDVGALKKLSRKNYVLFKQLNKLGPLWTKSKDAGLVNYDSNRNPFFLPYDYNRSCQNIPGFYVSASDVVTPYQNYMIMQAPKINTYHEFWKAILDKKVTTIVCLTNESDNGREEKSTPYWKKVHFPLVVDSIQVIFSSEKIFYKKGKAELVERKLKVKDWSTNKTKIIHHLHYKNWMDHTTGDPDVLTALLNKVDDVQETTAHPIAVHCSAGVGRSGAFVFAHSLRKIIQKAKQPNKVKPLMHLALLRMQRERLLENYAQYKAACALLSN